MVIDPLESVIVWLAEKLTIVEGRVAGKHRYGAGWSRDQCGVSVHLDGGGQDIYASVTKPRLEIRIYANDQVKIVDVWRELVRLSRDNARFAVNTSKGAALIHYFLAEASLSILYEDEINMDMGIIFFECMISEEVV